MAACGASAAVASCCWVSPSSKRRSRRWAVDRVGLTELADPRQFVACVAIEGASASPDCRGALGCPTDVDLVVHGSSTMVLACWRGVNDFGPGGRR